MRIAMWSGPRNLSTAMMYAFAARDDFCVMDEPFYAPFLKSTSAAHPMAAEVIASHETDPEIVSGLCARLGPRPHLYMKHMPHHMVSGFPFDWAQGCHHAHLLRHPARVIASYAAKHGTITAADIAYDRQFEMWQRFGGPVIESEMIRANPKAALEVLCDALGVEFQPSMLRWSAGGRKEDGVWARHWYHAVHASTGFAAPEGALPAIKEEHRALYRSAMPIYEEMRAAALQV